MRSHGRRESCVVCGVMDRDIRSHAQRHTRSHADGVMEGGGVIDGVIDEQRHTRSHAQRHTRSHADGGHTESWRHRRSHTQRESPMEVGDTESFMNRDIHGVIHKDTHGVM